jgi:hypothetical protein
MNSFSISHLILCTYYLVSVSYLNVEKYKYFPKRNLLSCVCVSRSLSHLCMHVCMHMCSSAQKCWGTHPWHIKMVMNIYLK